MARLPRLAIAGELHHVLWRGHPGQAVFADAQDRDAFVRLLREALPAAGVALHAFAVLPGRVHLLATPVRSESLGRLMQSLGRRFGAAFNRRHGRQGAVWDGRFRSSVIEAQQHLFDTIVWLETLPVREGLATHPSEWAWSSAAHHLGQSREPAVTEHSLYWHLGNTPFERERAHAHLLEMGVSPDRSEALERAVLRSHALGSVAFLAKLEQATSRPLAPRARGRPAKARAS